MKSVRAEIVGKRQFVAPDRFVERRPELPAVRNDRRHIAARAGQKQFELVKTHGRAESMQRLVLIGFLQHVGRSGPA